MADQKADPAQISVTALEQQIVTSRYAGSQGGGVASAGGAEAMTAESREPQGRNGMRDRPRHAGTGAAHPGTTGADRSGNRNGETPMGENRPAESGDDERRSRRGTARTTSAAKAGGGAHGRPGPGKRGSVRAGDYLSTRRRKYPPVDQNTLRVGAVVDRRPDHSVTRRRGSGAAEDENAGVPICARAGDQHRRTTLTGDGPLSIPSHRRNYRSAMRPAVQPKRAQPRGTEEDADTAPMPDYASHTGGCRSADPITSPRRKPSAAERGPQPRK